MIPKSRNLIGELLSIMADNLAGGGDPIGFRNDYWTGWAKGMDLPRKGESLIYTARMYQMLPYVINTSKMVEKTKPFFSNPLLSPLARMGSRLTGESLLRRMASKETDIAHRADTVLRGITSALKLVGETPAYLYEDEPYSGALPHDLGLEGAVKPHARKLVQIFKEAGDPEIIGVDPHSVFMLREALPEYAPGSSLRVRHYLEVLLENPEALSKAKGKLPVQEVVLHDSCQLVRDLGMVEQATQVAQALGLEVRRPENSGKDTGCCGGPIEFAFGSLSDRISHLRASELSQHSKNILVTCPICLINLAKHEAELGTRVWDLGELLCAGLSPELVAK